MEVQIKGEIIMYMLIYWIGEIKAVARNYDAKVLRNIVKCLNKEDRWELYNAGGVKLDSSEEVKAK